MTKKQSIRFLLILLFFCSVSTLGYCSMFYLFKKSHTEYFPINIPIQEQLDYTFEQKFKIKKESDFDYGFFLDLQINNDAQIDKVYDYFQQKNKIFNTHIEIFDKNNKLIQSTDTQANLYGKNATNIHIDLYRIKLKTGFYKVRITLSDSKPYPFLDMKTNFKITNGHRPK